MTNRILPLALSAAVLTGLLVTQSGCLIAAAAGAAAGTVAYVKGDLEAVVDGNPEKVANTTRQAMEELKFHAIYGAGGGVDGKVDGRTAADKEVSVSIKSWGDNKSKIWIRVGTFGDEAVSRELLSKIQSRLSPTAAPA